MNHKMERQPISQIMRAGQVTVRPDDSIETLQRLMMVEAWGQVPVVAVSRCPSRMVTAGSSALSPAPTCSIGSPRRSARRKSKISAACWPTPCRPLSGKWCSLSASAADELGMPLYFVGGLVRDLILGKPPLDVDMVVEGEAIKLARRLREQHGGEIHSHERFGTAKWLLDEPIGADWPR
jgi:tRNA nucleotidyltransferase (CCA-adding enzyme)